MGGVLSNPKKKAEKKAAQKIAEAEAAAKAEAEAEEQKEEERKKRGRLSLIQTSSLGILEDNGNIKRKNLLGE